MPIPSQTGIPYNKLATKSMVMDMRHKCNYKFCKNKTMNQKPIGIVMKSAGSSITCIVPLYWIRVPLYAQDPPSEKKRLRCKGSLHNQTE